MAATISTAPTSPAYHRDNNFVVLETDQIALAPATVDLDIAAGGPSLTETFDLTWSGITLNFVVTAATTADALGIPATDGVETLAEYAQRVADALRENDILTTDWIVQYNGAVGPLQRVTLEYRQPIALDVTTASTLTNVTVTTVDGVAAAPVDNLTAYLQVFEAADDPNDDRRIVSLHSPYGITARAAFDLKDLIVLSPALPLRTTIGGIVSLTWPHDEATGAWMRYYLRYAEKSGVPAVSSALLKSGYYYMLHGGRRGNYLTDVGSLSAAKLLHAYTREDGVTFQKPVGAEQSDWVYIWTKQAITDCYVELQITWDNGDVTTETPGYDPFDLDQYHVYWFSAGPGQIALDSFTPPSGATEPVAYNWRLMGSWGISTGVLITQVRFRIFCQCHPWNLYLLLDNGAGGCESVYVRGRVKTKYEVERDTARRLRWTDYDISTADLFQFNAEGQQLFEINTGWHEKYYIEHLRQMLIGQLWIIDTVNERFMRVLCDTKSIEVHEDDQQLYSLSLTLRAAWLDSNYHLVNT